MCDAKKTGTVIHRTLVGDAMIVETGHGDVQILVGGVKGQVVKLVIKAPREMPIKAVHLNPKPRNEHS